MNRQFPRALMSFGALLALSFSWQTLAQQAAPAAIPQPSALSPVDQARLDALQPEPSPTPLPTPTPTAAPWGKLGQKWILPVTGAKDANPFGNAYQYFGVYRGGHTGVDLAAPVGTPIRAVADGKVVRIFTRPNMRYGLYLVLEHRPGLFSLYGHTSAIKVKLGQQVHQGEVIALVGTSGAAGYPHLHVEALDRLPTFDGAWGYLYICSHRDESYNFINHSSFEISAIQRQYGTTPCGPKRMHEPVTYFNPEYLWSELPPVHTVAQPENDEWQRRQRQAPSHVRPASHPTSKRRRAGGDTTPAPGEGLRH